jgi:hypothetical protein
VNDDLDDGLLDHDPVARGEPAADGSPEAEAAAAEPTRFPDVHAFVTEHLAHAWARSLRDTDTAFRWCPRWHAHPPVLDRLTALWQAYEAMHTEGGTGPARWWRDHADPTLRVLTDPKGPFARCTTERHQQPTPLPTAPIEATEPVLSA